MKIKSVFAALFAAVGICSAALAVYIGVHYNQAAPQLLTPPTVARNKVVMMMNAVCDGDYAKASEAILGNPGLGVDRDAADAVGVLFWEAFEDSMSFELAGECYASGDGLAQNVVLTSLDIESITVNLKDRARTLLEKRVAEASDISEVYDENNDYREEFVMDVLYEAARQALEEDAAVRTVELTVQLVYSEGQWWVVADSALLDAISGGILY